MVTRGFFCTLAEAKDDFDDELSFFLSLDFLQRFLEALLTFLLLPLEDPAARLTEFLYPVLVFILDLTLALE
jgi:hypothetical protein